MNNIVSFDSHRIDRQKYRFENKSILLHDEYGNKRFGVKQFIDILRDRYPDAPENIIDILVEKGVIFLDGSQVTVKQG